MNTTAFRYARWLSALNVILGILFLVLPIVYMQIGPGGKEFYGPDVPDIYIYGGIITGKDLAFTPILIAMAVQAALIVAAIVTAVFAFRYTPVPKLVMSVTVFHSVLLLLFSWWIELYKSGVVSNSDCADLTLHWMSGAYVYLALVAANVLMYISLYFARKSDKAVPV